MKLVSVQVENKSIIEHAVSQFNNTIGQSLRKKLYYMIKLSLNDDQIGSNHRVKNLKGPIFELTISIPRTKELLRVLFYYKMEEVVLLTGYIIKPESYNDKKNTKQIKLIYEQRIKEAQKIYIDYIGAQKLNYLEIN